MKATREKSSRTWQLGLPAIMMMVAATSGSPGVARADAQDLIIPCADFEYSYAAKPGEVISPTDIETNKDAYWEFTNSGGNLACTGASPYTCAGLTVTVPAPDVIHPSATKTTITGTAAGLGEQDQFSLKTTDAADTSKTCKGTYLFRVTANGGGWGEPHLNTVNGMHYDFQSAGEFTALREDRLEIQTRQTAVPTATVPVNGCVAVYTAVAARVGSSRVTLQPNPNVEESRNGMELRVNGKLVQLSDAGIVLSANSSTSGKATGGIDGHIRKAANGAIEIIDARGTQLVATPLFWGGPNIWYLNVNVYQTSATRGTMGVVPEGSWIPALPDGTSLGPMPESTDQRYQDLYEKFADAWRVTDTTSLFDYAPGTNTATFTLDEWPRNSPQSCDLAGQTSVQPATEAVAQAACAAVTDSVQKADCVYDVKVTGHQGFGKSYEIMQAFKPIGTGTWYSPAPPTVTQPPSTDGGWAELLKKWWWLILVLILILLFLLFRKK
ncbi:hypothetical protein V1318_01885 [Lysobacter sp. CCNWLW3]|uniref:hypothetical protein n=1 Tax=unclassified Lysobacter TaxID=2635362 RepID=UPI002FD45011